MNSTTTTTTTTTMTAQMALALPEILSNVFAFNGSGSNYACALVCKSWKEVALDHIWAELPGPKPLALLLAPMVESENIVEGRQTLIFERDVSPLDWERAKAYLRRIKTFSLCRAKDKCVGHPHGLLDPSVFSELARTRPPLSDVLPNLLRLVIYVEDRFLYWLRYAILFLRPALRDITLSLRPQLRAPTHVPHHPFWSSVTNLFHEIPLRSPRLLTLRMLTKSVRVAAYDAHVARLLPRLASLETFEFSSLALTADVFRALARLPSLKTIAGVNVKARRRTVEIDPDDLAAFDFRDVDFSSLGTPTAESPFSELRRFAIQGPALDLAALFHNNPAPNSPARFPSLVALNVDVLALSHAAQLNHLLSALATSCPALELLQLTRRELPPSFALSANANNTTPTGAGAGIADPVIVDPDAIPTATANTDTDADADANANANADTPNPSLFALTPHALSPLPLLTRLEKFECAAFGGLHLSDAELVDLLARCGPQLGRVSLGHEAAAVCVRTELTIRCLEGLAERCPQLKTLGLCVRTGVLGGDEGEGEGEGGGEGGEGVDAADREEQQLETPQDPGPVPLPTTHFPVLLALRLALSPITSPFRVALYLSYLLPPPPSSLSSSSSSSSASHASSGASPSPSSILKTNTDALEGLDALDDAAQGTVRRRRRAWEEVRAVLGELERVRARERACVLCDRSEAGEGEYECGGYYEGEHAQVEGGGKDGKGKDSDAEKLEIENRILREENRALREAIALSHLSSSSSSSLPTIDPAYLQLQGQSQTQVPTEYTANTANNNATNTNTALLNAISASASANARARLSMSMSVRSVADAMDVSDDDESY